MNPEQDFILAPFYQCANMFTSKRTMYISAHRRILLETIHFDRSNGFQPFSAHYGLLCMPMVRSDGRRRTCSRLRSGTAVLKFPNEARADLTVRLFIFAACGLLKRLISCCPADHFKTFTLLYFCVIIDEVAGYFGKKIVLHNRKRSKDVQN